MESWQKVWREGFAPLLSNAALEALRRGLMTNDPQLMQSVTTIPPLMWSTKEWRVEGACSPPGRVSDNASADWSGRLAE